MSTHTPGPWTMEQRESQQWNSPSSPQRDIVRLVPTDFGGIPTRYLIGHVTYPPTLGNTVGAAEREANARLIAAAPELLAALDALVKAVEREDNPSDEGLSRDADEMTVARAAIQSATGAAK